MKNTQCNHQDIFNIDQYWNIVFGKNYEEVIKEHENDIKIGRKSRVENAFDYIKERLHLHTRIYTSRVTYLWVIESVFISAVAYLFKEILILDKNIEKIYYIILGLGICGIVVTHIWLKTLDGAKFCEENAEKHLMMLEEIIMGNISHVVWINPQRTQSISKSNFRICCLFFVIWILIVLYSFYNIYEINIICFIILAFIVALCLICYIKSREDFGISDIFQFKAYKKERII